MWFAASKCYIPEPYECPSFAGTKDLPSALPLSRDKNVVAAIWRPEWPVLRTNTPDPSAREADVPDYVVRLSVVILNK
jgi:hypothetical protein